MLGFFTFGSAVVVQRMLKGANKRIKSLPSSAGSFLSSQSFAEGDAAATVYIQDHSFKPKITSDMASTKEDQLLLLTNYCPRGYIMPLKTWTST